MQKFVILRGPSGSGKSTVASELQKILLRPTLLISEDQIRQMFNDWKMPSHTASKKLAFKAVTHGLESGYDVLYEGISNIKTYKPYFDEILAMHPEENYFFYLDVSFEETIRRHDSRPQKAEFGIKEMQEWWAYAGPTGYANETIIREGSTIAETIKTICAHARLNVISRKP